MPGSIAKKTGPVSYSVKLSDGRERRCHQDQVRKRLVEIEAPEKEVDVDVPTPPPDPVTDPRPENQSKAETPPKTPESREIPMVEPLKTYPHRERKPVVRFGFEPKW